MILFHLTAREGGQDFNCDGKTVTYREEARLRQSRKI